jgi:hypothetical protein
VAVGNAAPQPDLRVIADSQADWAAGGRQGEGGWVRGYYDAGQDPDGTYDGRRDFVTGPQAWSFEAGAWHLQGSEGLPLAVLDANGCEWTAAGARVDATVVQRWTAAAPGRMLAVVEVDSASGDPAPNLLVIHNDRPAWELRRQRLLQDPMTARFELELRGGDVVDVVCGLAGSGPPESVSDRRLDFRVRFFELVNTGPVVADSLEDWVAGGQGEGGWSYGFLTFPAADDTDYDPGQVTFDSAVWNLVQGSWHLGTATNPLQRPPWDRISGVSAHPGIDYSGRLRWVVRRWTSDISGPVYALVNVRKQVAGGDGVTVTVCVNGVRQSSYALSGDDTRGVRLWVPLGTLGPGDVVDFALDPRGLVADSHDGVDGSLFESSIFQGRLDDLEMMAKGAGTLLPPSAVSDSSVVHLRYPFEADLARRLDQLLLRVRYDAGFIAYLNGHPVAVRGITDSVALADSIRDWREEGDEGPDTWLSGYVARSPGQGLVYDPADLQAFFQLDAAGDDRPFWNGAGWDWPDGDPPWTRVYRETVHPNGPVPGPEHWAARRWVASSGMDALARLRLSKENTTCGDGVMAAIYRGAELLYSGEVGAWNDGGIDVAVPVLDLNPGETIDFVVGAGADHYCDGTRMQATLLPARIDPSVEPGAVEPREPDAIGRTETLDLSHHLALLQHGENVLAFQCLGSPTGDASLVLVPRLIANAAPEPPGAELICEPPLDGAVSVSSVTRSTFDADGDPLTVVDVFVPGAPENGAEVGIRDGWIRYTAPPGFTGEDLFHVVVVDTAGLSATGSVRVAVQPDPMPPSMLHATLLPDRAQVLLRASEPLDAAIAADPAHYQFPEPFQAVGVSVGDGAQLVTVMLREPVPADSSLTVSVAGLSDWAGNPMPAQALLAESTPNLPERLSPDQFRSLVRDSAIPGYHLLRISFGEWLANYTSDGDYLNTGRWLRFANAVYDEDGVPFYAYNGYVYNPTRTQLHCLSMYGKYLAGSQGIDPFLAGVDRLLSLQDDRGAFLYPFDYTHHFENTPLTAGWSSGLAQGFGLSVLARAYHLTGEERYREAGEAALDYLLTPMSEGGARTDLGGLDPSLSSHVWFEEWLVSPVPYTINGFMFTLLGLYDWANLAGDVPSARLAARSFEDGVATLDVVIPLFDVGGFTTYDLRHLLLGRPPLLLPDYHAVHVGTLHALRTITRSRSLHDLELRWAAYVERPTSLRPDGPGVAPIGSEWPLDVEVLYDGARVLAGTRNPFDFMGDVLLDGLPVNASFDGLPPLTARASSTGLASFKMSPAPRYGEPTRVPVDVVFPGWGEYQASATRIHVDIEGSGLLEVAVVGGDGHVRLAWPASSSDWHQGYRIYRSEALQGPFMPIVTPPLDAGALSYVDYDVVLGRPYYYRLVSVDGDGMESDFSDVQEVRTVPGTVDLFFLCGQSNISGRVDEGFVPRVEDGKVRYSYVSDGPYGVLSDSGEGFVDLATLPTGYYGPEIAFARSLVHHGMRPVIVKVSVGATSLAGEWNSRQGGAWYEEWKTRATSVIEQLQAEGSVVRCRAFCWMQGETDALDDANAEAYEAHFGDFVTDVRGHLQQSSIDASSMWFITALVREVSDGSAKVRAGQRAVMDREVMGCWFDTQDLAVQDGVHFTVDSVNELGRRFAMTYAGQTGIPLALETRRVGDQLRVTWRGRAGSRYALQSTRDFAEWSNVGEWMATGEQVEVDVPLESEPGEARFYRSVLWPADE